MISISTENEAVTLRELSSEDAAVYFEAYNHSRPDIAFFDEDADSKHTTVEETAQTLSKEDKLRLGIWNEDVFVGSINLREDESGAELGYWLDSRHTGNGYATLATRALTGYIQKSGKHDRIFAEVVEGNEASSKVLERSGYRRIGADAGRIIFEALPADNTGIDSLLSAIEGQVVEIDYLREFAEAAHKRGVFRGMKMGTSEGIEQFKTLYSQMWDRVADIIVGPDAEWRKRQGAKDQLLGLLEQVYDLGNEPSTEAIANIAFTYAFMDNRTEGVWGQIFGDTNYTGKDKLAHNIGLLCVDGNFRGDQNMPVDLARLLTNMTQVVYAHTELHGERIDKRKWLEYIRDNLLK